MSSGLFRVSLCLILVLMLCGYAANLLGGTQPIHPALRGFVEGCEDVPQPCWYGIVPGVTSRAAALALMQQVGYRVQNHIGSVSDGNDGVLVGESVGLVPASITYNNAIVSAVNLSLFQWQVRLGDAALIQRVIFRSESFILRGIYTEYRSLPDNPLTVFTPLESLSLYSDEWTQNAALRWRGFARRWRYCQLEPAAETCEE